MTGKTVILATTPCGFAKGLELADRLEGPCRCEALWHEGERTVGDIISDATIVVLVAVGKGERPALSGAVRAVRSRTNVIFADDDGLAALKKEGADFTRARLLLKISRGIESRENIDGVETMLLPSPPWSGTTYASLATRVSMIT